MKPSLLVIVTRRPSRIAEEEILGTRTTTSSVPRAGRRGRRGAARPAGSRASDIRCQDGRDGRLRKLRS